MIFNIIIGTAVVNIVLAVIAVAKGRNRLNIAFFIMSLLLGAWNVCVVLWKGYDIEIFSRINFIFVDLIPPAALYLVMALYGIPMKSRTGKVFAVFIGLSVINEMLTLTTFAVKTFYDAYYSYPVKVYQFAYEFITLFTAFAVLAHYYGRIKFRQERLKIFYVFAGFLVLFAGGMLDFTEGLGWHHLKYWGNFANTAYLLIIFYSIFKLRLLDAGLLFKNFMIYTSVGAVAGGCYTAVFLALSGRPRIQIGIFFILSILLVYFARKMHYTLNLFADALAAETSTTEARKSYGYIKEMNVAEEDKIMNLLYLLREHFEMEACIYSQEGGTFILRWATDAGEFKDKIISGFPDKLYVRYETAAGNKFLDGFGADLLEPLRGAGAVMGVLAGKKQTTDISFLQEELEFINEVAATITSCMNADLTRQRLSEEEGIKRLSVIEKPISELSNIARSLKLSGEDPAKIEKIMAGISDIRASLEKWGDFSRPLGADKKRTDMNDPV
jgi:hypothetical protein